MRGSCPTMKNRTYLLAAAAGVAAQGLEVQGVEVFQGVMAAVLVSAGLLVPGRPVAPALLGALDQEVQAAYQPRSRPT